MSDLEKDPNKVPQRTWMGTRGFLTASSIWDLTSSILNPSLFTQ